MTETTFTRDALLKVAEEAGVTADQARHILDLAGVTVQPKKPVLPVEPGSVIIATEVRGERGEWRMFRTPGYWVSQDAIADWWEHYPEDITEWDNALVLRIGIDEFSGDAPSVLTEENVEKLWSRMSWAKDSPWSQLSRKDRYAIIAMCRSARDVETVLKRMDARDG